MHHQAGFTIFVRQTENLDKTFAVGVQVFAAGVGAAFVNHAAIRQMIFWKTR